MTNVSAHNIHFKDSLFIKVFNFVFLACFAGCLSFHRFSFFKTFFQITTEDIIVLDKPIEADIGDKIRLNKVISSNYRRFKMLSLFTWF